MEEIAGSSAPAGLWVCKKKNMRGTRASHVTKRGSSARPECVCHTRHFSGESILTWGIAGWHLQHYRRTHTQHKSTQRFMQSHIRMNLYARNIRRETKSHIRANEHSVSINLMLVSHRPTSEERVVEVSNQRAKRTRSMTLWQYDNTPCTHTPDNHYWL